MNQTPFTALIQSIQLEKMKNFVLKKDSRFFKLTLHCKVSEGVVLEQK